jgi:hypothetical protein
VDSKDLLMYWILERERVRRLKEAGKPRPWSYDEVFQNTYFCNVRREDDKVTKWIRNFYSPMVGNEMFEYNIILSRFLNYPATLNMIGYQFDHKPQELQDRLEELAAKGKIWGSAYIITTHGIKMGKIEYLCKNVLEGVREKYDYIILHGTRGINPTLKAAHKELMRMEGLGSFLAAQVVADLKNTEDHPLQLAEDWWDFVAPGPGSIRGASWFRYDEPGKVSYSQFPAVFKEIREFVDIHWNETNMGHVICNQDLQNCLCEYDKFMRVRSGTGKSKRGYNGRIN